MRIIAGRHRGRAIRVARGSETRPTLERVREAIFNILTHGIAWAGFADARVLDLFAGTGALGLEALSRGAAQATFIDLDAGALAAIRRNAAAMGEARQVLPLKLDAARLPPPPRAASCPCPLAFLDPPYGSGLALAALQGLRSRHWLADGGLAMVEVGAREPYAPPPGFAIIDERLYGAARIPFLRCGAG